MSGRDYYAPGDWNVACSMCGRKRKGSEMVRNWQGMWRCPEHNEPRQPQDFVKGVQEHITPLYVQPQTDEYVYFCTINGCSAYPGRAYPGCMVPGNNNFSPIGD